MSNSFVSSTREYDASQLVGLSSLVASFASSSDAHALYDPSPGSAVNDSEARARLSEISHSIRYIASIQAEAWADLDRTGSEEYEETLEDLEDASELRVETAFGMVQNALRLVPLQAVYLRTAKDLLKMFKRDRKLAGSLEESKVRLILGLSSVQNRQKMDRIEINLPIKVILERLIRLHTIAHTLKQHSHQHIVDDEEGQDMLPPCAAADELDALASIVHSFARLSSTTGVSRAELLYNRQRSAHDDMKKDPKLLLEGEAHNVRSLRAEMLSDRRKFQREWDVGTPLHPQAYEVGFDLAYRRLVASEGKQVEEIFEGFGAVLNLDALRDEYRREVEQIRRRFDTEPELDLLARTKFREVVGLNPGQFTAHEAIKVDYSIPELLKRLIKLEPIIDTLPPPQTKRAPRTLTFPRTLASSLPSPASLPRPEPSPKPEAARPRLLSRPSSSWRLPTLPLALPRKNRVKEPQIAELEELARVGDGEAHGRMSERRARMYEV